MFTSSPETKLASAKRLSCRGNPERHISRSVKVYGVSSSVIDACSPECCLRSDRKAGHSTSVTYHLWSLHAAGRRSANSSSCRRGHAQNPQTHKPDATRMHSLFRTTCPDAGLDDTEALSAKALPVVRIPGEQTRHSLPGDAFVPSDTNARHYRRRRCPDP